MNDNNNWPDSVEGHAIEDPVDLADGEIDYSQNVLGTLWLERGKIALVVGLIASVNRLWSYS